MIHYLIIRYKRKLITPDTTDQEFYNKAKEELKEWEQSGSPSEAIDLIYVATNWLIHRYYFILYYKVKNIIHQILRK